MKKNAGMTSIDFLFSLTIASVFCMVMFALCFTFTVVEISQYIAFSVSRAHMAAHMDQSLQEQMAKNKFAELINNPVLKPLYTNGWFELTGPEIRGGGQSGVFQDYPQQAATSPIGIRLKFNAKLLVLNFSLLGSTNPEGNGFLANITGLLIREPTTKECKDTFKNETRYRTLLNLDASRFSIGNASADKYVPMEDNGC
jgi:hypothetical protein